MPKFRFELGSYLARPTDPVGVQGVLTSRRDAIDGENYYLLCWLDMRANECRVWFGEAQLLEANPTEQPARRRSA